MSSDTEITHECLLSVAQGNETAFARLFTAAYPAVYRAALLVTASPFLAEEVVQDVFLKIWVKRQDLPQVADFKAYLFIVARNQAYHTLKKQARWQQLQHQGVSEEEFADTDLADRMDAEKLLHVYEAAVAQLPPQQQQAYRLSRQQHLRREQVAAAMQLSPETVKKYLAAARLNIRAYCLLHAPELLPGVMVLCSLSFL